jgi:hypothetical protein
MIQFTDHKKFMKEGPSENALIPFKREDKVIIGCRVGGGGEEPQWEGKRWILK